MRCGCNPPAVANTPMIYGGPNTVLRTLRGGVVAVGLADGTRRVARRRVLACLACVLLVGLVGRAPTASATTRAPTASASATTRAYQSPLTTNPFAVGNAAGFGVDPNTSPAPPTRYEEAVLADKPTLYLPLTETGGTTAFDHSGNGLDGTYDLGVTHEGSGPLLDEPNTAVFGGGEVVAQSGDMLPSGSEPRTLEFWVHDVGTEKLTLARYGNVEGGHGFAVTLYGETLIVEAGGHTVSATTLDGFGHWCCDSTGWHMLDVTYDGENVDIYQDGQLLGGGVLGKAETETPGQGLRLNASYSACCGGAAPYGLGEAAIYPAALTPEQVGAHWSAGASPQEEPECAPTPSGPYPKAVLQDSPLVYYRMGEKSNYPTDRVAFDSSGHCYNGTFDLGASAGAGALTGDEDSAIFGGGQVVFQSGDKLPSGSAPRTLEFWVHDVGTEKLTLARYGNVEGGHGFAVTLYGETLVVEAGGHTVSATTLDGFGHWCCDSTGWHMVDVTYDGEKVDIYQDGQLIESKPLGGEAETEVPGQGLRFAASYSACCGGAAPYGFDEAAIYPSALSSARIVAHWEAASQPPAGFAVIAGTTNGGAGRIQACPTSGAACIVAPHPIDASGSFHMLVPQGQYVVTIFPPPGLSLAPKVIGPLTVPPSIANLTANFETPGTLPEGVSFFSGSRGLQHNTTPFVLNGEPSTLTIEGCKNGSGLVYVQGVNTSSGQYETRVFPLAETPAGSGTYIAQIAPLAPIHSVGAMDPQIACPTSTKMLPNGGSPSGGTKVILSGSGLEGATGVRFGSTPASSFTVTSDKLVLATAPPGTGVVPVTIVTPGGPVAAGNFNYFAVTGLSATAGPTTGGNTITIKGTGFNEVGGVEFGLMPAQSFKVVNESEITAEVPLGLGTVDVQVVNGSAASQQSAATQYTYEKGPAGSQTIVEPPSGGDTALELLAGQTAAYCSQNNCTALGYGVLAQSADQTGALAASSPAADESPGITPTDWQAIVNNGISDAVLLGCALAGPVSETVCSAIGVGLAIAGAWITLDTILKENHKCLHIGPIGIIGCDFWIDPSGTVIDTTGNAIAGATVTLLGQLAGEPFAPVPALSGAIQPAENPETTGASGEFDWDALAGTYKVEATAPGCYQPGNAGEPNVFTSPFLLPPPAVGLTLTLECPGSKPVTPAVTTLFPASGPSAGGNTVVIGGENLAGTVAVRFGGKLATYIKVLSSYAVAAVAPAGTSTTNVTVTTPGGTSTTGEATAYSYLTPASTPEGPVISSVSPESGAMGGGTVITIKGSHLDNVLGVSFGSTSSSHVIPVSPTEVQALAPASAFPLRVDVSVTTPTGTSQPTLADSFTYGTPPPPPATTVTLTASPSPATVVQSVNLTALVAPTDGGGSVAFYADGSATPLANCGAQALTTAAAGYQATCSTAALAIGGHTLKAVYSGDASYAESSGTTSISVTHTAEEEAKTKAEEEASRKGKESGSGGSSSGGGSGGGGGSQGGGGGGATARVGVEGSTTRKAPSAKCKVVHVKVKHSKKTKSRRVCPKPKPKKHARSKRKHGH